ncbi:hypothetical protein JMJ35_010715 [Cladonia borealis]|uniref:Zn(2)-C6 fungal-type domain-containing protein n=1 Tax=Cladonia borealis TaxID=184061 RepID=A0AA39U397_9LECA|nr:hypothetical protein JMJ35_010715 [Cladonia borealis]
MYTTPTTSFRQQPTALSRESSLPPDSSPQPQQKSTPGKERRKLRQSCDACAAAKVRCSKNRPRCERCTEGEFTCVYGPSMKHGKSALKRKHPQPKSVPERPPPNAKPSEHDLQRSFSDLMQSIFSTANLSLPHARPFNDEIPITGTTLPSAPTTTNSPSFDDLLWTDGISYGDIGSTAPSTSNCSTNAHLDTFGDTLSLISSANFPQFINSEPLDLASSPSSTSPVGPNTNRQFPLQTNFLDSSGTHNCYVIANSTLAILNVLPRPLNDSNSSETTTSSGCASTQVAQSLDDVLSCTRDAMGNMQHLLKCSCARDPHMAMLHASIIMRILFWHQLVAGIRTSSYLPLPTPDGGGMGAYMDPFASSSSTGTPAGWSSSGRGSCSSSTPTTFIAPEPVRLGNYIPDQEDQEHMQRLFLLINLQKVKQLIDAFAQVAELVDAGPNNLHTTLASWLNSELGQAVKEVGNGAKSAVGQLSRSG